MNAIITSVTTLKDWCPSWEKIKLVTVDSSRDLSVRVYIEQTVGWKKIFNNLDGKICGEREKDLRLREEEENEQFVTMYQPYRRWSNSSQELDYLSSSHDESDDFIVMYIISRNKLINTSRWQKLSSMLAYFQRRRQQLAHSSTSKYIWCKENNIEALFVYLNSLKIFWRSGLKISWKQFCEDREFRDIFSEASR